jgi:hypothetical protein
MKRFLLLPILLVLVIADARPCTVAVLSGRCTPDGRPRLWKHRDTDELQNALLAFSGGRYAFIGLVNSTDSLRESVWVGVNSAGFGIMNSASYNLILKDTVKVKDREGIIMKQALERCATLADFERLLAEVPKPLGVEANFGVIDASGGAAFYEVDNFTFKKLDANDPAVAPFGYIVHTNFSYTGEPTKGSGHIRYATAERLFSEARERGPLDERFLLQEGSRCLKHSLTGTDLFAEGLRTPPSHRFVQFEDYIPRHSTSASVVVQGVRTGETADLAALWTILGSPLTSVAIPVWIGGGMSLPSLLTPAERGNAPLCEKALTLKKTLFPLWRPYGERYMNLPALVNAEGTGVLQKLRPLEERVLMEAHARLGRWRNGGNPRTEIPQFYRWVEKTVAEEYARLFGL